MDIKELRNKLERLKGKQQQLFQDQENAHDRVEDLRKSIRIHEKALVVVRAVGLATQQQISYNVNEITSMALNAVLEDPYDLELEFIERRNRTECDVYFVRRGVRISPFAGGGGAVDVAGFALRVASWTMNQPRTRPTLILDEPFKHLKGEVTNRKMLDMVRQLSIKLGIQIIMVSDERVSRAATLEATDKLFETTIKKGVTKISEI